MHECNTYAIKQPFKNLVQIVYFASRSTFQEICLREFECVVCRQHMHPPIRHCEVGHSYCDGCYKRTSCCPQCRSPHSSGKHTLLEQFHEYVTFPCKYHDEGCPISARGSDIQLHERDCFITWKRCIFIKDDSCTWSGPNAYALDHYLTVHEDKIKTGPSLTATWDNFGAATRALSTMRFLVSAFRELFLCLFWVDRETGVVSWSVCLMGDMKEAVKFTFGVQLIVKGEVADIKLPLSPCGCTGEWCGLALKINTLLRHAEKYCQDGHLECKVQIYDTPFTAFS